ncbi:MAG: hypothetical protein ACYTGZ_16320 [Planctomycetota bacterium]|jgi:hypothetical protein
MRTLALIAVLALATACGKEEAEKTPDTSGDTNPAKTMMDDASKDMPKGDGGAPAMRTVTLDISGMS